MWRSTAFCQQCESGPSPLDHTVVPQAHWYMCSPHQCTASCHAALRAQQSPGCAVQALQRHRKQPCLGASPPELLGHHREPAALHEAGRTPGLTAVLTCSS